MYVETTWWQDTDEYLFLFDKWSVVYQQVGKVALSSTREKWSILLCCKKTLLTRLVHYMFPAFFLIYVIIKINVNYFDLVYNKHSFNNKVMP